MHEITAQLEAILQSLTNKGKKPSVALVKARLPSPVPMPVIIAALQAWKSGKHLPKIEVSQAVLSDQQKIQQLEQQLIELTQRVIELENKGNQ